jgi:outer membrane protein
MRKQIRKRLVCCVWIIWLLMLRCGILQAQGPNRQLSLPDAPTLNLIPPANAVEISTSGVGGGSQILPTPDQGRSPDQSPRLTRVEAEQMAIKNNPRVSIGHLLGLAQHQVVRETQSSELPNLSGNLTAVNAHEGGRISAGSITASRLLDHAGAGVNLTQLVTDFGRTRNLVASAKLQEKAQNTNGIATTEDIVLATDQAFYNTLQAQALLKVARQNVDARQATETQVSQLTKNNLRSTLDLSFADVNLSQAKLLQVDAQVNADSTMAAFDEVLGLDKQVKYELVEGTTPIQPPPLDVELLIQQAIQQRPDLQSLRYSQQAADKFSHAQHDQMLPTISAFGTAGSVPVRSDLYTTNWWGGIGVNLNIPIFNGFLYSSQAKEAAIRAQTASEQSRELLDRIVRDVRTSWLAASAAYQRVTVSEELLKQANLALSLAQTRYQLGLSSIVELSQAQFQQTDAEIGSANARYQYKLALSVLNYQIGATP